MIFQRQSSAVSSSKHFPTWRRCGGKCVREKWALVGKHPRHSGGSLAGPRRTHLLQRSSSRAQGGGACTLMTHLKRTRSLCVLTDLSCIQQTSKLQDLLYYFKITVEVFIHLCKKNKKQKLEAQHPERRQEMT